MQKHAYDACTAVIASISYEQGVEYIEMYPSSVTIKEFLQYLRNLRKHFAKRPLSLFLDNLSVHRNAEVQDLAEELNIRLIFNKSNEFTYQPIEETFNIVKQWYKKHKLNRLASGKDFDKEKTIKESFGKVTRKQVRSHINRARANLHRDIV